jgi:phosphoserine phosphatase RsbU/P
MVRRLLILVLALAWTRCALAGPTEQMKWRSGLTEIDDGWSQHDGDNLEWAQPALNDISWTTVDLTDIGPARNGWHWFRKRVNVGPEHPDLRLMIEGGVGTYELYVNGARVPGAGLNSQFNVYRPIERVFALHSDSGEFTLALRTHAPPNYIDYSFPLFLSVTMGSPTAIEYERAALQSERLDDLWPSIFINLLLCLTAVGVLCLYLYQRGHRDYLFLGLYFLVLGLSNGLWNLQLTGVAPTSLNFLGSDLLLYVYTILQIEFTFSFVGRRPARALRIYEGVLLLPWILAGLCWTDRFPAGPYALIEAAVTMPVAVLLTTLLLVLYRRGNREAGWLIFPSLLPLTVTGLFDLGSTSIILGWGRFDFLDSLIPVGLVRVQPLDLANLTYLLAICVVMFFRFTRVSREQAHAAAEFEAARGVQQRLVPPAKDIPGFKVESAYIPAAHVGGDFFFVRAHENGSLFAVIGDVSGKGLPAAMGVSAIMGALLAMPELPPAEVLAGLNRGIYGNAKEGFVTCCAVLVERDGTMKAANAGHLQPYRNGREIELAPALPLGLLEESNYAETALQLEPDDKIVMLSDGVVEARDASGELFGFDRTAAISMHAANEIARAAQRFGQEDDITVLTLSFTPVEVAIST